ncbi:MAG: hypothetical protein LBK61_09785 [Spirochaetaceae bacterium]|jgi:hypothetical protein|nr:hypothetical protein [Spirochaetaceae bacterium]
MRDLCFIVCVIGGPFEYAHPVGVLVRKGSQIAPKGVADLLLEGFSHGVAGQPKVAMRSLDKSEFSAQPKMRPNEVFIKTPVSVHVLQAESL